MFTTTPIDMENDPRANKWTFIRYSNESKGYMMLGEHPDGTITEIKS